MRFQMSSPLLSHRCPSTGSRTTRDVRVLPRFSQSGRSLKRTFSPAATGFLSAKAAAKHLVRKRGKAAHSSALHVSICSAALFSCASGRQPGSAPMSASLPPIYAKNALSTPQSLFPSTCNSIDGGLLRPQGCRVIMCRHHECGCLTSTGVRQREVRCHKVAIPY